MKALTTGALLKSGGSTSAWFDTQKTKVDDELISEFYQRFPEIEKIHVVSISSKSESGTYILFDFKRLDKPE